MWGLLFLLAPPAHLLLLLLAPPATQAFVIKCKSHFPCCSCTLLLLLMPLSSYIWHKLAFPYLLKTVKNLHPKSNFVKLCESKWSNIQFFEPNISNIIPTYVATLFFLLNLGHCETVSQMMWNLSLVLTLNVKLEVEKNSWKLYS